MNPGEYPGEISWTITGEEFSCAGSEPWNFQDSWLQVGIPSSHTFHWSKLRIITSAHVSRLITNYLNRYECAMCKVITKKMENISLYIVDMI